jgi:putative tryptophan/tyrosine transport system substrate-binding protein
LSSRRKTLVAAAGLLASPWRAIAQQGGRTYRLGWLGTIAEAFTQPQGLAFVRRLAELGFSEGRNLVIERRHAGGIVGRLPQVANELARANCDALFSSGIEGSLAALVKITRDTPIVFVAVDFDPVTNGHVASLARPGGRVTGVTAQQSMLPAKRLELLRDLLPAARTVAVFTNEETTGQLAVAKEAATRLGIKLLVVDFKHPFDYEAAFGAAVKAKADAVFVLGSQLWVPARQKLPDLARQAKLPSVFHHSQWVDAGGLMSYGFNFIEMWRRGAEIVAKVLSGIDPAAIPMEQPAAYEMAINTKTARALGLTVPPSFLLRADRIID